MLHIKTHTLYADSMRTTSERRMYAMVNIFSRLNSPHQGLPLSELEQYIRDYDLEVLASQLFHAFSTLEFVRLCFSRQRRAYWRAIENSAIRSLQPISIELGDSLTRDIFPVAPRSEAAFENY
jgi:hypothetical protein